MITPTDPPHFIQPRFIQIDEDGYFKMEDLRVSDAEIGRAWLASVKPDPKNFLAFWMHMDGQDVIVEAFDAPYVVLSVTRAKSGSVWTARMPYGHEENFSLTTLSLDEWDRFHGVTDRGLPFVFSRSAQAGFFDLLDSYDDDSIEANGATFVMEPWLHAGEKTPDKDSFWTERYQQKETPWDLQGPHPSLARIAAAIKLQRSRILILGCGRAHDAAWFARAGHIVTAMDFSGDAIAEAKKLYGDVPDLTLVQADAFQLPSKYDGAFDVVFDHTMYCAIDPVKRNDLVKVWRRTLTDDGHLLSIFFCNEKRKGPPFGGSEWELRSRLNKQFRTLYWQRLKDSPETRLGSELFVYAQKLPSLR